MKTQVTSLFRSVFGREPEFVTRAPGRIEFIGNHTDYNGGTVLGAAIDRGVWAAIAKRDDGRRRFYSKFSDTLLEFPAAAPARQGGDANWVNYPLGVIAAMPAFGLRAPGGFDFCDLSDLPPGAGMSSSAAIELSSALAFLGITGQAETTGRETVVKIGRHAENHFVGMPCGILDQGVSGFGKKDHLVFIDCRGPRFATVPMPAGAHFWIFNTHTKHALVDGLYAARNRECMEAAKALGVPLLADTSLSALEAGREKLSATAYKRARHVLEEIDRVARVTAALERGDLPVAGRLLVASHRSSQHQFENSTGTLDTLVDALVETPHVHGARLTGGGFG
ncbi:MAG: galactokinase, partial [Opitutaceae bacterium]|nr:galactokinase [Opitutaceae bacterium]